MTSGAVSRRINFPIMLELQPNFLLGLPDWRLPIEVEDFRAGTDEVLRVAMAVQAPAHAVRLSVMDDVHFVDLTVATHAADATIHVNGMVEVDVVGSLVDLDPFDWLASSPTLTDCLKLGIVFLHLGVAVHAALGIGNVGVRRYLNEAVAVTAIHAELVGMNVVGERYRLLGRVTDSCIFGCEVIPDSACYHGTSDSQSY